MNLFLKKKVITIFTGLFLGMIFLGPSSGDAGEWKGIRLTPYVGLSETYNDNVTFRRNSRVSDFITSLNAGLKAKYESRLSTFELAGVAHYNVFASHDEFNNVSGDVVADWKQELSKHDRIKLRNSYLHSDEPVSFTDAFNTRAGRFTYQVNVFRVNYEHDFNSQWSGTARYSNQFTYFSNDTFRSTTMNSGGAGVIYHLDSKTDFLFDADYQYRDFERGASATDTILTAGIRRRFTELIYFDGKIGMDIIDAYSGRNLTEPRFEARLTDEINQTTVIDVAFEKNYSLNSYVEDVFNHWQVSSSLKKQWKKRLSSSVTVFYGNSRYVASTTTNDFFGAGISLNYDLTKDWQGSLKYNFTDISSTDATQEYRVNLISLGVTRNF